MSQSILKTTGNLRAALRKHLSEEVEAHPDGVEAVQQALRAVEDDVPLPLTRDAIRSVFPVTRKDVRLFHEAFGPAIESVTGYEWPADRPSLEEFHDHVFEGMKHPLFLPVFTLISSSIRKKPYEIVSFFGRIDDEMAITTGGKVIIAMAVTVAAGNRHSLLDEMIAGVEEPYPELAAYLRRLTDLRLRESIRAGLMLPDNPFSDQAEDDLSSTCGIDTVVTQLPPSSSNERTQADWETRWNDLLQEMSATVSDGALMSCDVVETIQRLSTEIGEAFSGWAETALREQETAPLRARLSAVSNGLADTEEAFVGPERGTRSRLTNVLKNVTDRVLVATFGEAERHAASAEERLALARGAAGRFEAADRDRTIPHRERLRIADALVEEIEANVLAGADLVEEAAARLSGERDAFLTEVVQPVEETTEELASDEEIVPGSSEADEPDGSSNDQDSVDDSVIATAMPVSSEAVAEVSILGEAMTIVEADPDVTSGHDSVHEPSRVDGVLTALFENGDFGLAYHLASAVRKTDSESTTIVAPDEMRVVATAGRSPRASEFAAETYSLSLATCLDVANDLQSQPQNAPLREARRVALLASIIPVAAMQGEDALIATQVADTIGADGACAPFFGLVQALDENRKKGYPLTVSTLRAVRQASNGDVDRHQAEEALHDVIRSLETAKFRFTLGQRVKAWLVSKAGAVGQLSAAIGTPQWRSVAESFITSYGTRDGVVSLLQYACSVTERGGEVDGTARERLISIIVAMANRAQTLLDCERESTRLDTHGGHLTLLREVVEGFSAGVKRFLREAPETGTNGDEALQAAFDYARGILTSFANDMQGISVKRREIPDVLHAPLLGLSGLTWAGGWTPTPYDAQQTEASIIEAGPQCADRAEWIANVVRDRVEEGAFIAARMALEIAHRFDLSGDEIATLRDLVAEREGRLKSEVIERHSKARQTIDRIRRMAIGGLDASTRLSETLATIDPETLPLDVDVEFMPETVSGDRAVDFNSAIRRLEAVEKEAGVLLEGAKGEYRQKIDEIAKRGGVSKVERKELHSLLDADDLATVSDWIAIFEAGGERRPVLLGQTVNKPLARFQRSMTTGIPEKDVVGLLQKGSNIGAISTAWMDDEQRSVASNALQDWSSLRRTVVMGRASLQEVAGPAVDILSHIIADASILETANSDVTRKRNMFVLDVRMSIRPDPSSLVLPEFGSMTGGNWRLAVVHSTATPQDIVALSEGAEPRGTIVLYMGRLSLERRAALKAECIRRNRRVLVIDECLFIDSLLAHERVLHDALIVAQAFTTASPYKDYVSSPVPPEMFKGRRLERDVIVDPYGSYVVYGGRRLGKTALLRHISASAPEHARFVFVDMRESHSRSFWRHLSSKLHGVFDGPIESSDEFVRGVTDWLDVDPRRRLLVLLDEADNFVREQAESEYRHVVHLMNLMAETGHRFKFVLAGLHNVSRMVRTENSPLAQISNEPVRVGPLTNEDVGDAEFLVRGPLSALGYEFERREDVWRILSFVNYYPVLIQVFCQGLLRLLDEATAVNDGAVRLIDGPTVERALANDKIRRGLYESFDKTITHIEQRYELLTYILAERALEDAHLGQENEGLPASEVYTKAATYWPEAFPVGSDPSEVDDLLDEMEGFGLLRWTVSGRWALRSRTLLDLMVSSDVEILEKLEKFKGRSVEKPFDPRNVRRFLPRGARTRLGVMVSPLTDGQEAEILRPVNAHGVKHQSTVVFGTEVGGIEHVKAAIETSRAVAGGPPVDVRNWRNKEELIAALRESTRSGAVVVVTEGTHWTPGWIEAVNQIKAVETGKVKPIFIGTNTHAEAFVSTGKGDELSCLSPLRPWSRSFVAGKLDAMNEMRSETLDDAFWWTGGWNVPMHGLFSKVSAGVSLSAALSDAKRDAKRIKPAAVGVTPGVSKALPEMISWSSEGALDEGTLREIVRDEATYAPPEHVIAYLKLMGIVSFGATTEHGLATVLVNPLVQHAFADHR